MLRLILRLIVFAFLLIDVLSCGLCSGCSKHPRQQAILAALEKTNLEIACISLPAKEESM